MPDGIAIDRIDQADLSFTPILPASLGSPSTKWASSEGTPAQRRTVALVYEGAEGQPFVIFERLVDRSAAVEEYMMLGNATPGCTAASPAEGLADTDGQVCRTGLRELVNVAGSTVLSTKTEAGVAVLALADLEGAEADVVIASGFAPDPAIQLDIEGPTSSIDTATALELVTEMLEMAPPG